MDYQIAMLMPSPSFDELMEFIDDENTCSNDEQEKSDPFGTLHPYHPLLQRSSHPQEFFNMDLGGTL